MLRRFDPHPFANNVNAAGLMVRNKVLVGKA
jgi:hypothetical protein